MYYFSVVGVCGVIIMIALWTKIKRLFLTTRFPEVIEAGKYVSHLFKYDRKFITNDLSFDCYSKDGLLIDLKVTQPYRIQKEDLENVLFEFGEEEELDDYRC